MPTPTLDPTVESTAPTLDTALPTSPLAGRQTPMMEAGYWRSLEQLADSPEFRAAAELTDKDLEADAQLAAGQLALRMAHGDADHHDEATNGLSRRRFLQLSGAAMALAGAATGGGCDRQDKILPFSNASADHIPGVAKYYASTAELAGFASGLMVTSYDGRPIKVEGNPRHPINRGRPGLHHMAATLDFYDPDRSRSPVETGPDGRPAVKSFAEFLTWASPVFSGLAAKAGQGLAVLGEATSSPTMAALKAKFLKVYPKARWAEYEAISADNVRAGTKLAFGQPLRPLYRFDRAKVVVLLEADPFGQHPAATRYTADYATLRKPSAANGYAMSRIYAAEANYTVSGGTADHRLPLSSGRIAALAAALAEDLAAKLDKCPTPPWTAKTPVAGAELFRDPATAKFLKAMVADLAAATAEAPGSTLVVVGDRQPPAIHALGCWLNQQLGNVGKTVAYIAETNPQRPDHAAAIADLAKSMAAGEVDTLLILGGNPVYNAPADLRFADALAKVPNSIHLSISRDETSRRVRWHLARSHWLETWGDARAYDGTLSLAQPLIAPLYGEATKSPSELLAALLNLQPATGLDLTRQTLATMLAPTADFETTWRRALHDGLIPSSGAAFMTEPTSGASPAPATVCPLRSEFTTPEVAANVTGDLSGLAFAPDKLKAPVLGRGQPLEANFAADPKLHDGRFANNGWLLECPDPLTKLTWDNVILLAKATADALGIANATLVKARIEDRELIACAYILPGHAAGSATFLLGWGRTAAGSVGGHTGSELPADKRAEPVGFDAYPLRTTAAFHTAEGLELLPTGRPYKLASTQDHHIMDAVSTKGSADRVKLLAREGTLSQYREHPHFVEDAFLHPPLKSLWDGYNYDDPAVNPTQRKWSMLVDLSTCTGCNACVVACQAENNIPVVGKEQVAVHREMHWLRIDRYFAGPVDNPQIINQPVTCLHCETAPCEQVCPVNATVHNNEGLNVMVYNRCIGTRYCGNNCPTKVRRFNWFYNHFRAEKPENEVLRLVNNPEVTVRSRGVMEKCSFCSHRIQQASIAAKNGDFRTSGGSLIPDGTLQTACQQACSAGAITFGDRGDRGSQVSRAWAEPRRYAMLSELNIRPRLQYLARIRNPHPELADKADTHGKDSAHGHKSADKPH